MSNLTDQVAEAAIAAACIQLRMPTTRAQAGTLADAAARERLTYRTYLAEFLCAETDDRAERRRQRRIQEARFPRMKRLADFDLAQAPTIRAETVAVLAAGAFIDAGEPVVLLGDSGTGKTHLLIGLGVEPARRAAASDTSPRPTS